MQVRCFAHVREVTHCVARLLETDSAEGKVFNIGSDQPVSILELARQVIALSGSNSAIEFQTYADAYDEDFEDIRRRVPDLTRLRATIGHVSDHDLDSIIRKVIEFHRNCAS